MDALEARIQLARTETVARVSVDSSACFQVACVAELRVQGGSADQLLVSLERAGQLEWPVPTIFTKPVADAHGSESVMWILFNPD